MIQFALFYCVKMDKNTIIGFLLIGAIVIAFTILNRPSQEQLAEQQRLRDSIQQVEKQKAALEAEQLAADSSQQAFETKQTSTVDFFSTVTTVVTDSIGAQTDSTMAVAPVPTAEEFVILENEKLKLVLSTLGGRIYSVQLKDEKNSTAIACIFSTATKLISIWNFLTVTAFV